MEFVIGNNRAVIVYDDTVIIRDKGTRKFISLSLQEFVRVRDYREDINAAVDAIKRNESGVKLRKHLGNGIFVSVSSFVWCVDFRRFYLAGAKSNGDLDLRPSLHGIGLRIPEFRTFCEVIDTVNEMRPDIRATEICLFDDNHQSQKGYKIHNYFMWCKDSDKPSTNCT